MEETKGMKLTDKVIFGMVSELLGRKVDVTGARWSASSFWF